MSEESEEPTVEITKSQSKDAVKMETKVELVLDPDKLRCLDSERGITTTITVIT